MTTTAPALSEHLNPIPTIWGLSPAQLHDRFWASRGVQVVRRGEPSEIVESAELFLLLDPHSLVVFQLRDLVELLSWLTPKLLILRIRDRGDDEYREIVKRDCDGLLLGFDRIYTGHDPRLARIGLTPLREVARLWQAAPSSVEGWKRLRTEIPSSARQARRVPGRVFDARRDEQLMKHLECLLQTWTRPDSTIPRTSLGSSGVWADSDASVSPHASVLGSVWIGAGRTVEPGDLIVGPAVLWDTPESNPVNESVQWEDLEPVSRGNGLARPLPFLWTRRAGKRAFDIVFSLAALALTLPLYPVIALAIIIEDGWPVFFGHRRETRGGREFSCLKFRSMRRDAEAVKSALATRNLSDGPQFFVKNDPRSTRVGHFLRSTQLDELPQFFNVLLGHMSVVGPRPSPRRENQYCPGWREARLSMRPGITGLWQVKRTRAAGLDFQEWIRYDLEYVERVSWRLDFWIIWKTLGILVRRGRGR